MKVTAEALKEIEQAYKSYEHEVDQSNMTESTRETYLVHVRQFIKWLKGDFTPGLKKR